MSAHGFPPPWSLEELNDACFVVKDSAGQKLAYVYFEEEPGRRSVAKLLTKDEARRIAANIAKLPKVCESPSAEIFLFVWCHETTNLIQIKDFRVRPSSF